MCACACVGYFFILASPNRGDVFKYHLWSLVIFSNCGQKKLTKGLCICFRSKLTNSSALVYKPLVILLLTWFADTFVWISLHSDIMKNKIKLENGSTLASARNTAYSPFLFLLIPPPLCPGGGESGGRTKEAAGITCGLRVTPERWPLGFFCVW